MRIETASIGFPKFQPARIIHALYACAHACACIWLFRLLFEIRDCTRERRPRLPLRLAPRTNGTRPNLRPRHCILYCAHYLNERNFAVILPPSNPLPLPSHPPAHPRRLPVPAPLVAVSASFTLRGDYLTLKGTRKLVFSEIFFLSSRSSRRHAVARSSLVLKNT